MEANVMKNVQELRKQATEQLNALSEKNLQRAVWFMKGLETNSDNRNGGKRNV
jgi:hypothetical protein